MTNELALLAHRSVRQQLNRVSSVQLRRWVRVLRLKKYNNLPDDRPQPVVANGSWRHESRGHARNGIAILTTTYWRHASPDRQMDHTRSTCCTWDHPRRRLTCRHSRRCPGHATQQSERYWGRLKTREQKTQNWKTRAQIRSGGKRSTTVYGRINE